MFIINRHSPLVMIDWEEFRKILKTLTVRQLAILFKNDYGEDVILSHTKNETIDLIFREQEGDIT